MALISTMCNMDMMMIYSCYSNTDECLAISTKICYISYFDDGRAQALSELHHPTKLVLMVPPSRGIAMLAFAPRRRAAFSS